MAQAQSVAGPSNANDKTKHQIKVTLTTEEKDNLKSYVHNLNTIKLLVKFGLRSDRTLGRKTNRNEQQAGTKDRDAQAFIKFVCSNHFKTEWFPYIVNYGDTNKNMRVFKLLALSQEQAQQLEELKMANAQLTENLDRATGLLREAGLEEAADNLQSAHSAVGRKRRVPDRVSAPTMEVEENQDDLPSTADAIDGSNGVPNHDAGSTDGMPAAGVPDVPTPEDEDDHAMFTMDRSADQAGPSGRANELSQAELRGTLYQFFPVRARYIASKKRYDEVMDKKAAVALKRKELQQQQRQQQQQQPVRMQNGQPDPVATASSADVNDSAAPMSESAAASSSRATRNDRIRQSQFYMSLASMSAALLDAKLAELNAECKAALAELTAVRNEFGAALSLYLEKDEIQGILDVTPQVAKTTNAAFVDNLQSVMKVYKLAEVYDTTLCFSQAAYQGVFHNVVVDGAKSAGLPHGTNPLPTPESLSCFIKESNKAADLYGDIISTSDPGYAIECRQLTRSMIQYHDHECLDITVDDDNELILALGTDKAAFQHNGKNYQVSSVEDMTAMKQFILEGKPPSIPMKSATESLVALVYEAKREDTDTLRRNHAEYSKQINLHEEGRMKRETELKPLLGNLKAARLQLMEMNDMTQYMRYTDRQRQAVADAIAELEQRATTWYEAAFDQGWVEYVEGRGYFFVQWHIICDFACLQGLLDNQGAGSKARPCPLCDKRWEHFRILDENWVAGTAKELPDFAVFGNLPLSRYHACSMHCKHRITERFLYQLMGFIDKAYANAPANSSQKDEIREKRDTLKAVLNASPQEVFLFEVDKVNEGRVQVEVRGMSINGGKCDYKYDEHNNLIMVGMNGDEVDRFLRGAENMFMYVMGDTAFMRAVDWVDALALWQEQLEYMKSPHMCDAAEREKAKESAKAFVKAFARVSEKGITYYMHVMHDHPGWFYCEDGAGNFSTIAWWSAQAVEAGHKIRKRVMRNHTRQGQPIKRWVKDSNTGEVSEQLLTVAPAVYELFRWQYRILMYRRLQLDAASTVDVKVVRVGQLNRLSNLPGACDKLWRESELLSMFHCKPTARIRLTGPGSLVQPLKVEVSYATYSAEESFKQVDGAELHRTAKTSGPFGHRGRQPAHLQASEVRQQVKLREQERQDRLLQHAISQTGWSSITELMQGSCGFVVELGS